MCARGAVVIVAVVVVTVCWGGAAAVGVVVVGLVAVIIFADLVGLVVVVFSIASCRDVVAFVVGASGGGSSVGVVVGVMCGRSLHLNVVVSRRRRLELEAHRAPGTAAALDFQSWLLTS